MNRFAVDGHDLLVLAGWASLEYGISRWSIPAAWVVLGAVLLGLAFAPSWRKRN